MTRGPFDGGAESAALRSALARFATGVPLATCCDADGGPIGLTVNSFGALSLRPPLVQWSLRAESPSLASFQAAEHFAINVLCEQHVELSRRFAAPHAQRFEHGRWNVERVHEGWRYGPVRDPENKRSPYLVSWDKLEETTRKWDRDVIYKYPETLAEAGLGVVRV